MENRYQYSSHPEVIDRMKKEWTETWIINEKGGSGTGLIWDTMKAVSQGLAKREVCIIKKIREENMRKLEISVIDLENKYFLDRDKKKLMEIQAKKRELENNELQQA